jgi:hypothetical protein
MQLHLHRYNTYFLRFQSLNEWRDRRSTAVLVLGLCAASLWLASVPHNVTFGLWAIYLFARPLRKPIRPTGAPPPRLSLPDALLYQWLDGIPLRASTHRTVAVGVQMALQAGPSAQNAEIEGW